MALLRIERSARVYTCYILRTKSGLAQTHTLARGDPFDRLSDIDDLRNDLMIDRSAGRQRIDTTHETNIKVASSDDDRTYDSLARAL